MKKTIIIVSTIVVAMLILIPVLYDWSIDNQEVNLKVKHEAQKEVLKSNYDKMWKTIKQIAGVTEEYKDGFADMYKTMMEGRYKEATLMKWVTEDNPDFSTALYEDLNVAIEANRISFHTEQTKLIAIKEQHAALMQRKPSMWFINDDVVELEHLLVTSTITEKVFVEGKDDDIDLFSKIKPEETK